MKSARLIKISVGIGFALLLWATLNAKIINCRHEDCYNFHMLRFSSPLARAVPFPLFAAAFFVGWFAPVQSLQAEDSAIYIAIREDGRTGGGTRFDPFDGSTSARFVSLIEQAAPNTTIYVGPGIFPVHFVNLKTGIKLIGTDKRKTRLVWDGTGSTDYDIVHVSGDGAQVADLTIDCRGDIYPVTPNALQSFDASGVQFNRVRATNLRADPANPNHEWFPIAQIAQSATRTGGLIEDCEVDHFTGYGTMINFLHGGYGLVSVYMSGTIRNNYIHDCTSNGIGLSGAGDTLVTENTVDGSNLGIIHDTWFSPNVQVTKNKLVHLHQYGILWLSDTNGFEVATNGSVNAIISDNEINLTAERNDSIGIWVSGKNVKETQISGNTITTKLQPTPYMTSFALGYGNGTRMVENRATDQLNPFYVQTGSEPLATRNNRFLSTNTLMPVPPTAILIPIPSALVNVSTRGVVGQGDDVMIGGFIITGAASKKIVLRAIGPSLAKAGVQGALKDPILELHGADGSLIASNDNWKKHEAAVRATGVAPTNDLESALVATLDPGSYTAVVRGAKKSSGVALVELYDLNPTSSQIANISTRGRVDGAKNQLIGGFIVGAESNAQLMVRALGPSLSSGGVAGALGNPALTLYDSEGTVVQQDDNWRGRQEADIANSGIAPSSDKEAAVIASLPPGNYTAVVEGSGGGSGVALVEIYNLGE